LIAHSGWVGIGRVAARPSPRLGTLRPFMQCEQMDVAHPVDNRTADQGISWIYGKRELSQVAPRISSAAWRCHRLLAPEIGGNHGRGCGDSLKQIVCYAEDRTNVIALLQSSKTHPFPDRARQGLCVSGRQPPISEVPRLRQAISARQSILSPPDFRLTNRGYPVRSTPKHIASSRQRLVEEISGFLDAEARLPEQFVLFSVRKAWKSNASRTT